MITIKPSFSKANLTDVDSICSYNISYNKVQKNEKKKIPVSMQLESQKDDSCLQYYYHIPLINITMNYTSKHSMTHDKMYMVFYYDKQKYYDCMTQKTNHNMNDTFILEWNYLNNFLIPFPLNNFIYIDCINFVLLNSKFCVMNRLKPEYVEYVWKSICVHLKQNYTHPFTNYASTCPIDEINEYNVDFDNFCMNNIIAKDNSRYDFMLQDMSRTSTGFTNKNSNDTDEYFNMMECCLSQSDRTFCNLVKTENVVCDEENQITAMDIEYIETPLKKQTRLKKKNSVVNEDTVTMDDESQSLIETSMDHTIDDDIDEEHDNDDDDDDNDEHSDLSIDDLSEDEGAGIDNDETTENENTTVAEDDDMEDSIE